MTENEKLRKLLEEARQELAVLASYVDDPETKWPTVGLKLTAKAHKRAVTRIDAALAEPVSPVGRENARLDIMWQQLVRERDEALAEVRRTYKELSESIVREAEAYERGAEKMRDAAVAWLRKSGWFLNQQVACSVSTLPIPEDK